MAELSISPTELAVHEFPLTSNVEQTVEVTGVRGASYSAVELIVHSASAPVYFRWGGAETPAADKGRDCDVFPAAVGSVQLRVPGYGGSNSNRLHLVTRGAAVLSIVRR